MEFKTRGNLKFSQAFWFSARQNCWEILAVVGCAWESKGTLVKWSSAHIPFTCIAVMPSIIAAAFYFHGYTTLLSSAAKYLIMGCSCALAVSEMKDIFYMLRKKEGCLFPLGLWCSGLVKKAKHGSLMTYWPVFVGLPETLLVSICLGPMGVGIQYLLEGTMLATAGL